MLSILRLQKPKRNDILLRSSEGLPVADGPDVRLVQSMSLGKLAYHAQIAEHAGFGMNGVWLCNLHHQSIGEANAVQAVLRSALKACDKPSQDGPARVAAAKQEGSDVVLDCRSQAVRDLASSKAQPW